MNALIPNKPKHSPLGASGAERWMNCPGSNVIINALNLPPSDEEDFAKEGTAAHEAAAKCVRGNLEPWEVVGEKFYEDFECTVEMADALRVYLDYVKPLQNEFGTWWCEFGISSDAHPLFYGTVDFAAINEGVIDIVDFKYGAGIIVEPEWNAQLMYYAYGFLLFRDDARRVRLTIVQPRAFHEEGAIRSWEISAEELAEWGDKTLIASMHAALIDETFDAGPWCRFCPAKLACPLLDGLFKAAANVDPKRYGEMTDDALGRDYNLIEAVKLRIKAVEAETLKRLNAGKQVAGTKLVNKRANRVWKDGAEVEIKTKLGSAAYTEPVLKSPAQVEALGAVGKDIASEWCFTPNTGYTVARADDRRQAVRPQLTTEVFSEGLAKIAAE